MQPFVLVLHKASVQRLSSVAAKYVVFNSRQQQSGKHAPYLGRARQRCVALTNAPNVLTLGDRVLQFDDRLIEAPILLLHGANLAQHLR